MGRKGGKGIKPKKRNNFLARMGVDTSSTFEPVQSVQAVEDGQAALRARILESMGKGSYEFFTYKGLSVSLREDPGKVRLALDYLVSQGQVQKGKKGYGIPN